jgi:voltage-gated potassium channel
VSNTIKPTTLIGRIIRKVQRGVAEVTWPILALAVAVHVGTSWLSIIFFGEGEIASASIFPYYYLTTATTVGYGDFSPATTGARYIAGFWIMPGAVLLFTAVVGKLIQAVTDRWTKAMKGREDYSDMDDHVVVFGWQGDRTRRLIELLLAEEAAAERGLVLVADDLEDNPMPERISFIRVEALSSAEASRRSAVARAKVALILGDDDDTTLAAALAVGALPTVPRIVAYFQTTGPADLLRSYCPTAEAQESLSIELMARSAYDPGASRLQRIMLSSLDGPTQYSFTVPSSARETDCASALTALKEKCDATLIGVQHSGDETLKMNPAAKCPIKPGDRVFYIADHRLKEEDVSGVLA